MRILYLSDIRFPLERANGIQTMETCHALSERGHDVTLRVRRDTAPVARDPFAFYGLPLVPTLTIERALAAGPAKVTRAMYVAGALRRTSTRKHDLVFTRDLGVASALLRLPPRCRLPIVYESHGLAAVFAASLGSMLSTATSASARKQRRLFRRERLVWHRADGYVTITSTLAQELEARFGSREHQIVVPDGVRLPQTRAFRVSEPTASPLVAYAGHLYPWKGVDTLLDALTRVPHARGLIVGGHPSEPDLSRLLALATRLGVADRVTFTGLLPPSDVAAQLSRADVLVLPNSATAVSARYTSPLKLFEYLAVGRPIVASDLPALREVLRHENNALLVRPDDAEALAAGIKRITSDGALAARLARTAFDDSALYTWQARAARLESLFRSVIADRAPLEAVPEDAAEDA